MPADKKPAQAGLTQEKIDSIVDKVIGEFRKGPAVRTDDRTERYTRTDLNEIALDNGLSKNALEARLASEERSFSAAGTRNLKSFRPFAEVMRSVGIDPRTGRPDLSKSDVGLTASGFVGHLVAARGNKAEAYKMAKANGAPQSVVRALGESTLAGGGALVPVEVNNDYIELLYATTAYLRGNPIRMPLSTGTMQIPRIESGASASWVGEGTNAPNSSQTFGSIQLSLKTLSVTTAMSNQLMAHSAASIESLVRDDIIQSAGVTVDSALIRGTGTAFSPTGLKNSADPNTTFTANATVNVANVTVDLAKAQRLQMDQKVSLLRAAWLMSPRSFFYLKSARDGNNNLVWAAELAQGQLEGKPVFITHNIPDNISSTDSEVYLVSYEHEIFAEGAGADGMRIDVSSEAAYHDGSSVVSAFSLDQSVVRMVQRLDRASRQDGKNITLMNAIKWT